MTRKLLLELLEAREVPAANFYAVGSIADVTGTASLVDAETGLVRFTVSPFGTRFMGGIHVAVGDVTGDTVPDLITAPGAGGSGIVKVFDGVTGTEAKSFSLFDSNFRGGLYVAVGDVNLDGVADIIAGTGEGGGPLVAVIDGKAGATLATFLAFEEAFRGGVRVAAGDVDGDGRLDVIAAAGPGGGPHVKAFGIVAGSAPKELFSYFAYQSDFSGGVFVASGDVDSDGIADVITGAGDLGGAHVKCFRGSDVAETASFLANVPDARDGVRVSTVNGGNGANCQVLTTVPAETGSLLKRFTGGGQLISSGATATGFLGGPTVSSDNAAVMWDQVALQAVQATGMPPPRVARALAIVHTAIFDAVNSTSGKYSAYHYTTSAPAGANAEAAALAAGQATLAALFPTQATLFQTVLTARLALIPDSQAKTDGIVVGNAGAADILAFRANDGSATAQFPYTPGTNPGNWQPTPPANAAYLLPGWGNVATFAIPSKEGFTADPPPALDSQEYADAFNEVKAIGAATGSTRTADQTQIAFFWLGGGGTITPPGMCLQVAEQVIRRENLNLLDSARALALVSLAVADAGIIAWDAKLTYNLWRPVTAIRAAATDGNPLTEADANWSSFITTPPFPDHTSGHSTFSSAAAAVLENLFGANYAFRTFSQDVPGVSRAFDGFQQAAAEAGISRIYGGIHVSYANEGGLSTGRAIGQYIAGNVLEAV